MANLLGVGFRSLFRPTFTDVQYHDMQHYVQVLHHAACDTAHAHDDVVSFRYALQRMMRF